MYIGRFVVGKTICEMMSSDRRLRYSAYSHGIQFGHYASPMCSNLTAYGINAYRLR
jgi:hypothetical protein